MKRYISLALGLILLLSGCSPLFDREVYSVTPHLEQRAAEDEGTGSLRASNAQELEAVLMRLIRARAEEGTIRLTGYSSDAAQRDSQKSIVNVSNEPFGAYAVKNITFERTAMLTDYELTVYITYRRTKAQMDSVQQVLSLSGLQSEITSAITSFKDALVVETNYYDHEMMDLKASLETIYYQNPQYALGLPVMTYTLYPETGINCIIEMEFTYSDSPQRLHMNVATAEIAAAALIKNMPEGLTPPETALWLHNKLCEHITYDVDGARLLLESGELSSNSGTIFGALCDRLTVGEGYALTYKRLCDLINIDCQVVLGKRDGVSHAWNVISLEGSWYHVDVSADDAGEEPAYDFFLLSDDELEYRFSAVTAPRCDSDELSFEIIAEKAFPELYAKWLEAQEAVSAMSEEEPETGEPSKVNKPETSAAPKTPPETSPSPDISENPEEEPQNEEDGE